MYFNESQLLAEGADVACLRWRFSFVLHQALSFRTRHRLRGQGVAFADTRQLRSQDPVSAHAHCTEEVIGSEGREGASGVRGEVGVGVGNGDGNDLGAGTRTVTAMVTSTERERERVEASERTPGGNGDGSGDGAGAGAGAGTGVETRGRT